MGTITIGIETLKELLYDGEKSAQAVNLVYVNDSQPGFTRKKTSTGFIYKDGNKRITDKDLLLRIKKLVIPPAWQKVWICPIPNGHLQVTGYDLLNRKQYKYHPDWNELRNHSKFSHLYEFGKALPVIRAQLEKDLSKPGLPMEKVLAAVVSIMQCTSIRIGNSAYEKLYGSFGLTTLKDQHVKINGSELKFSFKGKKGVYHNISLKSRKLASIVKNCRDIPGKELFQYYDNDGNRKCIDSGMVNDYIRQISGKSFTAKDFRTWSGTLLALSAFKTIGYEEKITAIKKKIVEVIDTVSKQLGNTRSICRKYYIHPAIIALYTSGDLKRYFRHTSGASCTEKAEHTTEEKALLKILRSNKQYAIAA